MEGPKLQDAESSAIINWTCSEFCSREAKFQLEKCGIAKITKSLSVCLASCLVAQFFSRQLFAVRQF